MITSNFSSGLKDLIGLLVLGLAIWRASSAFAHWQRTKYQDLNIARNPAMPEFVAAPSGSTLSTLPPGLKNRNSQRSRCSEPVCAVPLNISTARPYNSSSQFCRVMTSGEYFPQANTESGVTDATARLKALRTNVNRARRRLRCPPILNCHQL